LNPGNVMTAGQNKKGKVVIISGPSGVGKSTICRELVKRLDNAYLSVSVTTRPRAATETEGRDYRFVSEQQFRDMISAGALLEYAEVFGHLYGTPREPVETALAQGKTVILEIDVKGGRQVKLIWPDAIMIFILPPSQRDLVERMRNRGREDSQTAELRLDEAGSEIAAAWQYYEHMVINDNLEQAVNEVLEIVQSGGG